MINRDITVAVTGYDIAKILETSLQLNLLSELIAQTSSTIDNLYADGYTTFITPLNDGFEMLVADTILKKRELNPGLELIVVLPSMTVDNRYSSPDKYRYKRILEQANKTVIIACTEQYPSVKLVDFIVDNTACMLCYYDGRPYKTEMIYSKSIQGNKRIVNLCNNFI